MAGNFSAEVEKTVVREVDMQTSQRKEQAAIQTRATYNLTLFLIYFRKRDILGHDVIIWKGRVGCEVT